MMNPGSSKPRDNTYTPVFLSEPGAQAILENRTLVETKPDNAQYQIMRLMMILGWKHVRVLNLSDIREPKSGVFLRQMKELDISHSIWCKERSGGLNSLLGNPSVVVKAWSQEKGLLPLAEMAESALATYQAVGVAKGDKLYAYPSPMLKKHKDAWLSSISGIVAAL